MSSLRFLLLVGVCLVWLLRAHAHADIIAGPAIATATVPNFEDEIPNRIVAAAAIAQHRQSSWLEWIFGAETTTTAKPEQPQRKCAACSCGRINTYRRIVGGQETEVHQYPWMAPLLTNGRFYCGAALINDLYVITAAHCVRGFYRRSLSVRLLVHNIRNHTEEIIERRVDWVAAHHRYSSYNIDNDIALVRLSEPVTMDDRLRPVCMPKAGETFNDRLGVVTGWGALSESGPISETLQEVNVTILSQEECRGSNYGANRITDNMLCAGFKEGGKDSCQGDSGGPLHVEMDPSKGVYQLAGIVSWGEGCARPDSPGVYTRVNRYLDWIKANTRDACACSEAQQVPATTTTEAVSEASTVSAAGASETSPEPASSTPATPEVEEEVEATTEATARSHGHGNDSM